MNVGARHAVPLRHAPKGAAWEFRRNDGEDVTFAYIDSVYLIAT
jgi:hypothetical protein